MEKRKQRFNKNKANKMKIKEGETPRIYVSGKITGIEEMAATMFKAYSEKIKAMGYEVVNPMELPHDHGKTWPEYMREDIAALMNCHAVYFLPSWSDSEGAKLEFELAERLNYDLIFNIEDLKKWTN